MKTYMIKTYSFEELCDGAKQKALDNNRDWNTSCDEWWDSAYEDFYAIGEILGVKIDNIWFSGFASQGDGLCFTGRFEYSRQWRRRLESYAPKTWEDHKTGRIKEDECNKELHAIGERLQSEQRHAFYGIYGDIKHHGHYNHSGCTEFDIRHTWDGDASVTFDPEDIKQILRELMDTFYQRLTKEYEYLTGDEAIGESLIANECEFTESGETY